MIRLADRSDLKQISMLLCEFLKETSYSEHVDNVNQDHICAVAFNVLHQGYIWLYEVEGKLVGLLAAVKEPNVWIPSKTSLRELVWYVKPEYRNTAGSGKLFIKFNQMGAELLESGQISLGYFTTRMGTTVDFDLESRGFRLVEKLYLKDTL
jgi:hypothetical protein